MIQFVITYVSRNTIFKPHPPQAKPWEENKKSPLPQGSGEGGGSEGRTFFPLDSAKEAGGEDKRDNE